MSHYFRINF